MNLEDILVKSGLDPKEAKVYLTVLDLGTNKVHTIAKHAGIKRPTAYVVLESLYAKNFVIKTYKEKKIFYAAEKPDIILRRLKEREELLASAMPALIARMGTNKHHARIKIYDGASGIEQVYEEIYASAAVDFLGSVKYLFDSLSSLPDKLKKIIKSQEVTVRDLLADDPRDIDFALNAKGRNYEARVVPKNLNLQIDCAIYGNKVALLAVKKDLFAIVIESVEVSQSFSSIFNFAWDQSTPLSDVVKGAEKE